jgi:hypothetical protein
MSKISSESRANLDVQGGIFGLIMVAMVVGCYIALRAIIYPFYWVSDKLKEKRFETASFESRHEFL